MYKFNCAFLLIGPILSFCFIFNPHVIPLTRLLIGSLPLPSSYVDFLLVSEELPKIYEVFTS